LLSLHNACNALLSFSDIAQVCLLRSWKNVDT